MTTTDAPITPTAAVAVPTHSGMASHLRAIRIVCHRELLRFRADRTRMVSSLVQPLLFLFVLGTGLSSIARDSTGGFDYRTFMYPGVLAMSVLFTAMFSAMSIVWDREFGFLREMLVAPVPRSAILVGKALGGSIVATGQGIVILALAGFAGVPYHPLMLVELIGELFLLSFAICSFGLLAAARLTQIQAFMAIMNLAVMPLFYLSGALYPLANLPDWMQVLARFSPITYAVAAMRHTVFAHLDMTAGLRHSLDPGISWFGWHVSTGLELLVVAVLGLVLMGAAVGQFRRVE